MRLDSELACVLALPSERRTVKAAARCLKASVSGPPPAASNSWRNNNIDAYVLPEPLHPIYNSNKKKKNEIIINNDE